MPTDFPDVDPVTGELVAVAHYGVDEIAALLHVSPTTVRKFTHGTGQWPHLYVVRSVYMSAAQLARALELMTVDPDAIPDHSEAPPLLGTPVSDAELETIR